MNRDQEKTNPSISKTASPAQQATAKTPGFRRRFLRFCGRLLCWLLVTVLLLTAGLYGVMYILAKGPSPTARDRFVLSVRETSAIGFLANLYLSAEEIAEIESGKNTEIFEEMDTSLITISSEPVHSQADAWGFVDEDGDGIILDEVKGQGYSGYMMIVLDPSRVIMGSVPESFYRRGYTIEEMVQHFDAVAGTNAGGFEDENGMGNGSEPDTAVVYKGQIYFGEKGTGLGFVGFDDQHILHVGLVGSQALADAGIQYGCSFGPVLVHNGEGVDPESLASGINPRTAIGQRSDGAVLMLVIDGRQVISLGATYSDLMEIMLRYGAVNACNLDGGSSSLMYYNGKYVNNSASVIGIRPVPSSFIVLKEGARERDGY